MAVLVIFGEGVPKSGNPGISQKTRFWRVFGHFSDFGGFGGPEMDPFLDPYFGVLAVLGVWPDRLLFDLDSSSTLDSEDPLFWVLEVPSKTCKKGVPKMRF